MVDLDIETYVLSPESSEDPDEVQFISETRINHLPLNKVARRQRRKRLNKKLNSRDCTVTDGIDELLRPNNMVYIYAYESTHNTNKENKSFIYGTNNNVKRLSKKEHAHKIVNKSLINAEKESKYKVAIYEISDDDDDDYHEKSSLPNNKASKIISDNPRIVKNIVHQDENMNELLEDVIFQGKIYSGNLEEYGNAINEIDTVDKTETDCIIAKGNAEVAQESELRNDIVDKSVDVNWNMDDIYPKTIFTNNALTATEKTNDLVTDGKFIHKRKKLTKKNKRLSNTNKNSKYKIHTPVEDLSRQSIFSTSEENDSDVETKSDKDANKDCYEIVKGKEEPARKLVPRSASAMSLRSLLDLYSGDVEKVIQEAYESESINSRQHTEDFLLGFSKTEGDCKKCKSCNEKFECLFDLAVHRCTETKQSEKRIHLSEIDKKIGKKQPCGDSIEDEIEKIFLWSLELSKGMLPNDNKKYGRGKDEGEYICPLCNKLISRRSNLKKHIRRHATPIYCKYCDKGFVEQHNLDKHIITNHQVQRVDYPKMCDVCQRPFVLMNKWFQHMKIVHPDEVLNACHLCKTLFDTEQSPSVSPSNGQKSQAIASKQPLMVLKGKASQLPVVISSKNSMQNIAASQFEDRQDIKQGPVINFMSEERTVVSNLTEIHQNIFGRESIDEVDLNGLGVDTSNEVVLNGTNVSDFNDPQSVADHSNVTPELASLNNNNIEEQQVSINTFSLEQSLLSQNNEQTIMNHIKQTYYKECPLVSCKLSYLNNTNKYTYRTCENSRDTNNKTPVNKIKVGHFSNINDSQRMLELVDMIESSAHMEPTEFVSPHQTTQCVDAVQNTIDNTQFPQVIVQQDISDLIKMNLDSQSKVPDLDTSCKNIESVNSIEPMDIASIEIESRMQDYISSGLGDPEEFLRNHGERPSDVTEMTSELSGEINTAGQNIQQAQTKNNTTTAFPLLQLIAQTDPAQNIVIKSLAQQQGTPPAPEQNIANETIRLVRRDQPYIVNGATYGNVVNSNQISVISGSGGVTNITFLYV